MKHYHYRQVPTHEPTSEFIAQTAPVRSLVRGYLRGSGKVTVGVVPRGRADSQPDEVASIYADGLKRCHWDYQDGLVSEVVYPQAPLGLSSVPNCHEVEEPASKKRERYGLAGLTASGKERIQEGSLLLEHHYGVRRLGFYTLTCPYTELSLIAEFNRNIAQIQRRYFQKCKRAYEKRGEYWHYISVLEFQSKRWERDWEAALHVHYIAPCYRSGSRTWVLHANQIREIWRDACGEVIGRTPDVRASVDSQVCKKSVSGYLSKYMCKGGEMLALIADMDCSQVPSQWWSMSAFLKRQVKAKTVQIPEPIAQYLFGGGGTDPNEVLYLHYRKDIFLNTPDGEKKIGMIGRMCALAISALHPGLDMELHEYHCSIKKCPIFSRRAVDKN